MFETNGSIYLRLEITYEMDPNVVNDARYRDTIRDDLKSLPVISVVMNQDFLPRIRDNTQ